MITSILISGVIVFGTIGTAVSLWAIFGPRYSFCPDDQWEDDQP